MDPATIEKLLNSGFVLTVSTDGTMTFQKPASSSPEDQKPNPTTDKINEPLLVKEPLGTLLLNSIKKTIDEKSPRCFSPTSDDLMNSLCKALEKQTSGSLVSTAGSIKDDIEGNLCTSKKSWNDVVVGGGCSHVEPKKSTVKETSITANDLFGKKDLKPEERILLKILQCAHVFFKDEELIVPPKSPIVSKELIRSYCEKNGIDISKLDDLFNYKFSKFNKGILSGKLFLYVIDESVTVNFSNERVATYKEDISCKNVKTLGKAIFDLFITEGNFNENSFKSYNDVKGTYTTNIGIQIREKYGILMSLITKELVKENSLIIKFIKQLVTDLNTLFPNIVTFEISLGQFKDRLSINASVLKKNWESLRTMKAKIDTNSLYSA
jgi:hypothetical protein